MASLGKRKKRRCDYCNDIIAVSNTQHQCSTRCVMNSQQNKKGFVYTDNVHNVYFESRGRTYSSAVIDEEAIDSVLNMYDDDNNNDDSSDDNDDENDNDNA